MYIVFEGIDGSGKTTQAHLLLGHFAKELDFIVSEPKGVAGGLTEAISSLLKSTSKNDARNSLTDAFLFSAARSEIMQNVVIPKLARDGLVIGDRSIVSTFAYQLARGANKESLYRLYSIYLIEKWPIPDLIVFLDIDYDTFMERMVYKEKGEALFDRFELDGLTKDDLMEDIMENYRALCKGKFLSENWLVIDGKQPVETIHEIVLQKVSDMKWV